MRNFEVIVRLYCRDGYPEGTRVLGFHARNMSEACQLVTKEVLRQTGETLPWEDLRDVTEE